MVEMGEIYVVRNIVGVHKQKVEYVGTDAEKAQKVCDENRGKRQHPCFIQVWEDEEQQYVTRKL